MTVNLDANSPRSTWLKDFIESESGVSGTIHRRDGDVLVLDAAHNIPDKVLQVVQTIPKGKGMAGLAWEREVPVSTCNLKTDSTGDVRPGAKAVNAHAAVAMPVGVVDGNPMFVVGIAYMDERDFDEALLAHLNQRATEVLELSD
jgi:hypothetical protein